MVVFDLVSRSVRGPRCSRNKYQAAHASGRIRLDRMLVIATQYPAGYGCVPGTLGQGGDLFDALVLVQEPARAGSRRRSS